MENNNMSSSNTGTNKNLIYIIAFVILGVIVGYFLGNSKLNTNNQGAQTISSDIESTCGEGQIFVFNRCVSPTKEQMVFYKWMKIREMPIIDRSKYILDLINKNSQIIFQDETMTKYDLIDSDTGMKIKTVGVLNEGYTFGNQKISEDGKTTTYDILKEDPKNPGNYIVVRELGCGGSCGSGGCCQLLFGWWGQFHCDCDRFSWDDFLGASPVNGC